MEHIAFILVISLVGIYGLTGDHICQKEERYYVNVTEYYLRNVTTRSYKWCMQVPPRCSTFSFRTLNDSRIVKEERTRLVDACCEGFERDPLKETCVAEKQCHKKCMNGVCNEEGKCYCNPGFRGDYCEKGCEEGRWGRYCRYHCSCERGTCDPNIGHCYCPAGWTGIKCEVPCQEGRYGEQCLGICNCSDRQICEPQTGRCTSNPPTLTKYHTFNTVNLTERHKTDAKKIDLYVLTSTELSNKDVEASRSTTWKSLEKAIPSVESRDNSEEFAKSDVVASKGKASNSSSALANDEVTKFRKDDVLIGDSPLTKITRQKQPEQFKEKEMFNFATVSFAAIVFIAVTGVIIIGHLLKTDGLNESVTSKSNGGSNKESTVRQSIFHSPLPEPPQSPFFETPLCSHYHKRIGDNEVQSTQLIQTTEIQNDDNKVDIFYDQLPPTNRCILKVVDENAKDKEHYAEVHKIRNENENVYDEIACLSKPEAESLYINTQSENKTQF